MKIREIINETIPLNVAKMYRRGWDKTNYVDIFKRFTDDQNAYRIYLPLNGSAEPIQAPERIASKVESKGYRIEDYAAGIATDGRRKIRIGRILQDDPELLQTFVNDPNRAGSKNEEYLVCISRHPYDIASMSTGRGWQSCMQLTPMRNNDDETTDNSHYVFFDIKEGTLVAYLIKNNDKNINHPLGRLLIKPFVNPDVRDDIILYPESTVYGTNVDGFKKTVEAWLDQVNPRELSSLYCLNPHLYNDGSNALIKTNSGKLIDAFKIRNMSKEEKEKIWPVIRDTVLKMAKSGSGLFGGQMKQFAELIRLMPVHDLIGVASDCGWENLVSRLSPEQVSQLVTDFPLEVMTNLRVFVNNCGVVSVINLIANNMSPEVWDNIPLPQIRKMFKIIPIQAAATIVPPMLRDHHRRSTLRTYPEVHAALLWDALSKYTSGIGDNLKKLYDASLPPERRREEMFMVVAFFVILEDQMPISENIRNFIKRIAAAEGVNMEWALQRRHDLTDDMKAKFADFLQ
jgi:hypothetical protein